MKKISDIIISEKGDNDDNEEDEDEDKINPFMKYEKIKVNGNINRVKSMRNSSICALWNDSPSVDIIDCEELIDSFNDWIHRKLVDTE